MISELKIGQRWEYDSIDFHFIIEISSERPCIKCSVIQSFLGYYKVGYISSDWRPHEREGSNWQYLQGQDKPSI